MGFACAQAASSSLPSMLIDPVAGAAAANGSGPEVVCAVWAKLFHAVARKPNSKNEIILVNSLGCITCWMGATGWAGTWTDIPTAGFEIPFRSADTLDELPTLS